MTKKRERGDVSVKKGRQRKFPSAQEERRAIVMQGGRGRWRAADPSQLSKAPQRDSTGFSFPS